MDLRPAFYKTKAKAKTSNLGETKSKAETTKK